MSQGTIKKVIADKGFGFIEGERGDLFSTTVPWKARPSKRCRSGSGSVTKKDAAKKDLARERQAGVTPPLAAGVYCP